MLKQRVITALVLLGVLVLALTAGRPYGFPLFALLAVGVVVGEWLQLLHWSRPTSIAVAGTLMVVLWAIDRSPLAASATVATCAASTAIWLGLMVVLFTTGRFPPSDRWRVSYAALALLLPAACWFALAAAYREGLTFLLSLLAAVWAADIAAYFAGRAFGKRKLAPAISPGKTWAGAVGGALGAAIVAIVVFAVPQLSDGFFAVVERRWSAAIAIATALALTVVSIVGDLFESHLKRQRGVKDSSRLLPGHGGVFDRVDAMLPVMPAAMLLVLLG